MSVTQEEYRRPFNGGMTTPLLDIGCGNHKHLGSVGMDKLNHGTSDITHDLEVFPWPVKDGSFEAIIAWHVLEHLKPWLMIDVMNECWRVLKPDGLLYIAMPIAGSEGFYQDPTHTRTWNAKTPKHFDPESVKYQYYRPKPWKVEVNKTYRIEKVNKTAHYFVMRKRGQALTDEAATYLHEITERLKPENVVEIGTFVGTSTLAMSAGHIYTCDKDNAYLKSSERITCFPKQTSTEMLALLSDKVKADFFFFDGRIQEEDLPLILAMSKPTTVYAFDDYNGGSKGVFNVGRLWPLLTGYRLVPPPETEGVTIAVLEPDDH